jgi:replicative DNA helicase
MELHSIESELQLLQTVTSKKLPKKLKLVYLGKLTEATFHHSFTKEAFNRIITLVKTRNHLIDWKELLHDPSLGRDARDLFEDTDTKACRSKKSLDRLLENLEEFRKRRELFDLVNSIADDFKDSDEKFKSDSVLDTIANSVGKIRENMVQDEIMWNFGAADNADAIIEQALYKPTEAMYKTGFTEYDTRNGGLPTIGVMIMAGTTSGGKSVVSSNLEKNMCELNENFRGCKITLEMSEEQEMKRILAMISGIPFSKIKQGKLTDREKKKIEKDFKVWRAKLKAMNSSFSYMAGTKSRTIDQLLSMLVPYAFNTIMVDYISLLDGVDDDNQWRLLSSVARECKVFAAQHKCLIILLAQLDTESSKIRYSQGIKEHSDVTWKWNYSNEEVRATGIIPIEIDKVRDGELFVMPIAEKFSVMQVCNPEESDLDAYEELKNSKNRQNRRRKPESDEDDKNDKRSNDKKRSSRNKKGKDPDDLVLS